MIAMSALAVHGTPRQDSHRRRSPGFTLIELLIALTIVGLMTLALFSGLNLGSRAWESVDAVSERVGEIRVARDFLMSTLSQTRPVTLTLDAEARQIFAGDAERLEFAAPLGEQVGIPGIYILRLELAPNGQDSALVLTRWLLHPEILEGSDGIPAWEPLEETPGALGKASAGDLDLKGGAFGQTLLLDRVDTFELAYFGIVDGDTEPDWHKEWLQQTSMPTMLRIRLGTPGQSWPTLIVALPERRF